MTLVRGTGTNSRRPARGSAIPRWKRPLDLGIAGPALLALSPLMAVLAALVRLTSPGPVFFVQERVGLDGRPFGIVRSGSMHRDAEGLRQALLPRSDRRGPCFKLRDDPRITPLGRFLRRSSLDELPQLFNVIRSEMSLVGRRPALPEEVAAYPQAALERLSALPGITGVWQVSGRAEVGFDEMVRMDVTYARGATLAWDLAILLRTLAVVATGRGAY